MKKIILRIEDDIPEGEALLMVHRLLHSELKDSGKAHLLDWHGKYEATILQRKNSENSYTYKVCKRK